MIFQIHVLYLFKSFNYYYWHEFMLSKTFCLFNAHHKIRFAISNHEWVFNQFSMDETKPPLYCFIPDFFSFEFYIFNIHKFCVTVILCPLLWSIFFSNFFRSIVVSCVKNPIIFTLLHRYSSVAHMCVCKTSAHLAARVEDNSMLYCCALRATRSFSILVYSLLLCQRPSIFGRLWTKKNILMCL